MTKAEIQLIRSLADKRTRDTEHLFVAEGFKLSHSAASFAASVWRKSVTLHIVSKINAFVQ